MKFDLTAAKAYVGGIIAAGGPTVSDFIIKTIEAGTGFDIPASIETAIIIPAVTFALGYVGVYFTKNKAAA